MHGSIFLATIALLVSIPAEAVAQGSPDFHREVRPLLSSKCFACHGPDADHREAELRLDRRDDVVRDRDGIFVVKPGDVNASELMARITSDDHDVVMPPPHAGEALTTDEVDTLRRWIDAGAPMQPHWAYIPPVRHDPPRVQEAGWVHNVIDNFVLSKIEERGLQPSDDADPVTLIRRLSFDLTGLPPEPAVVNQFVEDPGLASYESIVDQLLHSDAHAERLTVWWLDLVRYADTVGYHGDQDHNISPYRDWVIDAFAANMPFDQFSRDQLAGDLVSGSTIDQKIASGYNRLLQTSHEGGLQPKEYLAIYAADRVRNVSGVWMGATVGCAQCHDHKYDPYTARDFYSLAAFFADLDDVDHFKTGTNALPTRRNPEIKVLTRRERQRLEELEIALQAAADDEAADLRQQIEDLKASARSTMISATKEPRVTRILPRGNWLDETGPEVQPSVPEFLGSTVQNGRRQTRLDLADWLFRTGDDGIGLLTARVFSNRFWQLCFGRGLSAVPDDFGGQGEAPTHPELLDELSIQFVESNWNVRQVLKTIVMSRAYRQSSNWTDALRTRDPDNELFARQSSWRLNAEAVRDTVLEVSGLLVKDVGGPSVKPYQPAGYFRHLNFPKRTYQQHTDERQWRRGLYVHWQRQFLHPMLKAFDAPSREECTAQRARSNTPLAALTLLNDPGFVAAAQSFARRVLSNAAADTDAERIDVAMMLAVSRNADDREHALLSELLNASRQFYAEHPDAVKAAQSTLLTKHGVVPWTAETAAWAITLRAVLNLDELITRY